MTSCGSSPARKGLATPNDQQTIRGSCPWFGCDCGLSRLSHATQSIAAHGQTIAEAALAACKEKGYNTAVAVVDRAGQVMVILRDEQATAQQAEMARRKAYTARMFRTTTLEFQKRTSDPAYAAQRDIADILALGGGVPIQVGNDIVGGVGSSGSSQEMDDACAKAGVAKVAGLLK
jgi:uncharacterized protein GlcG (DUF336 family)